MTISVRVAVLAALSASTVLGQTRAVAGAGSCEFHGATRPTDYSGLAARMNELQSAIDNEKTKDVQDGAKALAADFRALAADSENLITVRNAASRVAIHLANSPPTRLRLSFDAEATGRHIEVEWDPTVASDLGRTVTLEPDTWRIVTTVEPQTYTQNAGSVIIQTRFGAAQNSTSADGKTTISTIGGTYVALVAALNTQAVAQEQTMSGWPRPRLTFQCVDLPKMEDARFAPAPAAASTSGLRGFGLAPAAVTDTLSILAEIAVERAKAGAMQLLQKRLVDPFCTGDSKVSLGMLGLGHSDELALPRTCELLESLRLDDILSSGRPLLIALRDDLRHTVAPEAIRQIVGVDSFANTLLQAAISLVNSAVDHGGIDALDTQLALDLVGDVEKLGVKLAPEVVSVMDGVLSTELKPDQVTVFRDALKLTCDKDKDCEAQVRAALRKLLENPLASVDAVYNSEAIQVFTKSLLRKAIASDERAREVVGYACQARLVVATVKRCQHDGCTAEDVAGMLSKPEASFAEDQQLPLALCWTATHTYQAVPADAGSIQRLVIDGLHLVAPVVDGKGRDRAKAAVHLIVELMRRHGGAGTLEANTQTFVEIADALIDEDYGTALNGFVHLAGTMRPGSMPTPVRKVVEVLGAVTSYAAVYKDTKDEDPKAARETRKQALESLIDAATDRTNREGDLIVSVGSNVGLSATWTNTFDVHDDSRFEPAVRVPLGISVDFPKTWIVAFRGGVQLADLGQFVHRGSNDQTGDVSWADFVSPGFEVGFSFPGLSRALNLSFHVAYAPTIPADTQMVTRDGVWRFGLSLGYYVPFFDFN